MSHPIGLSMPFASLPSRLRRPEPPSPPNGLGRNATLRSPPAGSPRERRAVFPPGRLAAKVAGCGAQALEIGRARQLARGSAFAPLVGLALALMAAPGLTSAQAKETIAFLRHGEKPPLGLGQIDCQGLNRALKLPAALAALFPAPAFPTPAAIFVPDPSVREDDHGVLYDYVRPLETIAPTAVALGMPINAQFGHDDVKGLTKALEKDDYRDALVLVAWEHRMADKAVRKLVEDHGGDPDSVPKWERTDFDSVYVVTIDRDRGSATFEKKAEGLNGQPEACPQ